MPGTRNHRVGLPALAAKLEGIKEILGALTAEEREVLLRNPVLVQETFGSLRRTSLEDKQSLIEKYRATKRPFPLHDYPPVVKLTAEQSEEARKLQLEILRKRGVAEETEALSKIHGERIDPFPDDPDPASDEEE